MKKYDVTVHFKYDPEDEREEDFELETDDMDSAKQFIKERDDFDSINYFIIETQEDEKEYEYYNSSEERLINGRLSEAKAEQMHENLDNEYRDLKRRLDDLESEMENLMNESNQAIIINNGMTDYNTDDKKERYDIVHTVLENIILNRESRYILTINIHNKINEDVKTIKIDTYKKKIIQ